LVCACAVLAGCGGATSQIARPTLASSEPARVGLSVLAPSGAANPAAPFRFFSPSSFWNQPVPAAAALDPSSTEVVGALDAEVAAQEQAGIGPWSDTASYSVPIYTVPANQPPVHVQLLTKHPARSALQAAFNAVPLPPNALPARGRDGHLVVWQPSTDRLWEFYRLSHGPAGWQATWGGAMRDVSLASGAYGR